MKGRTYNLLQILEGLLHDKPTKDKPGEPLKMSKEGAVREQILDRSYKPLPAKRTDIPKPDGSMRGLNVPAARDRVVQAGLANYLDYRKDFEMSNSSYGFRKNRRCEQAILKGLEFMNDGYNWIVDIDLRKFFDTVDQDRLIRLIDNLFHNRVSHIADKL